MSSPSLSSETSRPADLFENLWRQLLETHQNALQELEAKVSKLKKERCLDAQKLEVFFNRHQQLKEQNKNLQDTVIQLEERLRSGVCDQCAVLKENLKNNKEENLQLIDKLKNERKSLEDENRKLEAEVEKLKKSHSAQQQTLSPEHEEGIIPDSPVLTSSLPAANKLRKRRNMDKIKHVRYAESFLPQPNNSIFNEPRKVPGRAEVLVPNTCELDTSQISNYVNENMEVEIAETCALDLLEKPHMKTKKTAGPQSFSESSLKFSVHLKPALIHSPDSTTLGSPSLLPRVKRLSKDDSVNRAKRKKEEDELEDKQGQQPELIKPSASPLTNQSFKKETLDIRVRETVSAGTSSQKPNVSFVSPGFKKPLALKEVNKGSVGKKGNHPKHPNASHEHHKEDNAEKKIKVEPMWSIDPALALSMYDSECERDEEEDECHGELEDTDCTWVSHSVLQRQDRADSVPGLGEKANDSLDMMFDTTACGEYKSFNSQHIGQSQPCEGDDDGDEEDSDCENNEEQDPDETTLSQIRGNKASRPAFAHVAVIRKKDERRKLKGTTCKECEVYYAHLPEEEKQKKLSSCSRHRFLYVPPCTPENFWEVGFPSTQTCIERGYIREETNPEARTRRRQPFNALFSPKRNQQESNNSLSL
ncbi:DNA endonuclease RBBP8 isoform X2 [Notolabrus celidotus]|uniref:DNA endonuclease RBBP8 isoform X2 n=1 Tax=Notolabrus celidotus TaxID=1203425 RepID=UPI00148F5A57|nr:DNA endonuclease RBBP8 isoform X2 [Notolabrus celidotus]